MKVFQASLSLAVLKGHYKLFPYELLDVLLSLAFGDNERWSIVVDHRHMMDEVICDPGAFSVARGKSSLTLAQVINMLQVLAPKFNRHFNFDTDFSTSGFANNHENLMAMRKAGHNPVPVIHNFFGDEIDFYVKQRFHDWLALGSSQSTNFDDVRYAVERIKKADPTIKIHWFGGSTYDWLIKLPIAACDTTSWEKQTEVGHIMYWNPDVEKAHKIYVGGYIKEMSNEYHFVEYPWRKELEEFLDREFKIVFRDLLGNQGVYSMFLVNTHYYSQLAKRINEVRQKTGVPLE